MQRYAYLFKEGSSLMRAKIGLKGARLSEMFKMGLPTPPGLIISTSACVKYFDNKRSHEVGVQDQVKEGLEIIEKCISKKFGDERDPLLLAVRPSTEIQMPGILKDICNIGLNHRAVIGLARVTGNEFFAWNSYKTFIEEFSIRSLGIHPQRFIGIRDKIFKEAGNSAELSVEKIKLLVNEYLKAVPRYTGRKFPQDPEEQLWMSIETIYNNFRGQECLMYRRLNDLDHLEGTAIALQQMAYGNLNDRSGAGRIYTRNPITGEKGIYGEFLMNSQLEPLLDGVCTPNNIEDLRASHPIIFNQLDSFGQKLERRFQDVQDVHFIIQNGQLYLVHSKNAKLGPAAEVKTAVDLVREGIISERDSIKNIYSPMLSRLHHKVVDSKAKNNHKLLGKGISGSLASATGQVLFDRNKVIEWSKEKKKIILITKEALTDNYLSIALTHGYITQFGGSISNASLIVRDKTIAAVLSCGDLEINEKENTCRIGSNIIKEGDVITVNGLDGEIYSGEVPLIDVDISNEYQVLSEWASKYTTMRVLVNGHTKEAISLGKKYGAEGIGLCKTEFMLDDPMKKGLIRKAILSDSLDERKRLLEELVQFHKEDFKGIFKVMSGKPCTVRIFDPPLNFFLPSGAQEKKKLAEELGFTNEKLNSKYAFFAQCNPTLGVRGSRLAFMHPEFVRFQVKSMFIAALESVEEGITPLLNIEIPMICSAKEFTLIKEEIEEIAKETGALDKINYRVGLLVEIPRAAFKADTIAKKADFMHFGADDLTQLTCGLSREDSDGVIDKYLENGIFSKSPFVSLDISGVGELMKMTIKKARKEKKSIKIGLSGKHSSDSASVQFCQDIGVNELTCPAEKVPTVKIMAAQAALLEKKD